MIDAALSTTPGLMTASRSANPGGAASAPPIDSSTARPSLSNPQNPHANRKV